jgi:Bifunctional DNA primase/polymerase, N-terminal
MIIPENRVQVGKTDADRLLSFTPDELWAWANITMAFCAESDRDELMLANAIDFALNGWDAFPLCDAVPILDENGKPTGRRRWVSPHGKDPIPGSRGNLDATTNTAAIIECWTHPQYRGSNIGLRPPNGVFVVDCDPRKPGFAEQMQWITATFGEGLFPPTLTHASGRGDGGRHLFYRHPRGMELDTKCSVLRPPGMEPQDAGIDLKDHRGYVCAPPSIHPATGRPYWVDIDMPIARAPELLLAILKKPDHEAKVRNALHTSAAHRPSVSEVFLRSGRGKSDRSVSELIDDYNDRHTFADLLLAHGWACRGAGNDSDGEVFLHPAHTSNCSATVDIGPSGKPLLYVWTPNTPLEQSSTGDKHGLSKFDVLVALEFNGDVPSALRALSQGKCS